MKNKIAVLALSLIATVGIFVGCGTLTLDPDGVYQGDTFLAKSDQQIKLAENSLATFVGWEYTNHAAIQASWPSVTVAANTVRAEAPGWFAAVGAVRADYIFVKSSTGALTNSAALNSAETNLTVQVTLLGSRVTTAQAAVNTTTLTNKPTL